MATTLHCLAHLAGFKDEFNILPNFQKKPVRCRGENGERLNI